MPPSVKPATQLTENTPDKSARILLESGLFSAEQIGKLNGAVGHAI